MADEIIRYSDEDLEEFKTIIKEKLEKAKQDLAFYLQEISLRAENSKLKGLDDSSSSQEVERINNLAVRTRKHIKHLENALIRIDNKVYGICRETGKLIAKKRLLAVPHATLSIQAKNDRKPTIRRRR